MASTGRVEWVDSSFMCDLREKDNSESEREGWLCLKTLMMFWWETEGWEVQLEVAEMKILILSLGVTGLEMIRRSGWEVVTRRVWQAHLGDDREVAFLATNVLYLHHVQTIPARCSSAFQTAQRPAPFTANPPLLRPHCYCKAESTITTSPSYSRATNCTLLPQRDGE